MDKTLQGGRELIAHVPPQLEIQAAGVRAQLRHLQREALALEPPTAAGLDALRVLALPFLDDVRRIVERRESFEIRDEATVTTDQPDTLTSEDWQAVGLHLARSLAWPVGVDRISARRPGQPTVETPKANIGYASTGVPGMDPVPAIPAGYMDPPVRHEAPTDRVG